MGGIEGGQLNVAKPVGRCATLFLRDTSLSAPRTTLSIRSDSSCSLLPRNSFISKMKLLPLPWRMLIGIAFFPPLGQQLGPCDVTIQGGPKVNFVCKFPFHFRGNRYDRCTGVTDPDGKLWCSTKTSPNGTHIGGEGNWGYCRKGCDKEIELETTTTTTAETTIKPTAATIAQSPFSRSRPPAPLPGATTEGTTTTSGSELSPQGKIGGESNSVPNDDGFLRCDLTVSGGPQVKKPCVFPFVFRGVSYPACTREHDPNGRLWCSTKTFQNGTHVKGNWGYCNESQQCRSTVRPKKKRKKKTVPGPTSAVSTTRPERLIFENGASSDMGMWLCTSIN